MQKDENSRRLKLQSICGDTNSPTEISLTLWTILGNTQAFKSLMTVPNQRIRPFMYTTIKNNN
ncbi:Uncharacterized protein APZ42_016845 [Daphnia magna]|uniref:Uncharacterized protein n=1 Tax=Daphnia magna TaxID=35525 RepID=A0A165A715_9CRUS|nr:Uncharacterized protein APZ42_016845 [Daphnia magna]